MNLGANAFHGLDAMATRNAAQESNDARAPENQYAEACILRPFLYMAYKICWSTVPKGHTSLISRSVSSFLWSQIQTTFFKFCDSLVSKTGKMKKLVRELEQDYKPEDVVAPLTLQLCWIAGTITNLLRWSQPRNSSPQLPSSFDQAIIPGTLRA